jgi:hypothetical protein
MISTEAGGEGINLQFCALMINYDIPWNPNRLEQRMGRIHRYGQEKEVYVYNLVAEDTREGGVLAALFRKLGNIQAALGSDRVFDVIGDILPGVSLKDLIVDAVANRRTLDEIVATLERVPDEEVIRRVREASLEALATRHLDLQRVLGEERRARENRLVPEYIERFFERANPFLELRAERRRDGLWRLERVPFELRQAAKEHGWGPLFEQYLKIAFDKRTAWQQGAEFVAPGHPLLETMAERLLALCAPDLARGAVFADPDGRLGRAARWDRCHRRATPGLRPPAGRRAGRPPADAPGNPVGPAPGPHPRPLSPSLGRGESRSPFSHCCGGRGPGG